ncbi:MAG: hypothetical protein Q9159_002854 [Coniocarpon cinnabarinum]
MDSQSRRKRMEMVEEEKKLHSDWSKYRAESSHRVGLSHRRASSRHRSSSHAGPSHGPSRRASSSHAGPSHTPSRHADSSQAGASHAPKPSKVDKADVSSTASFNLDSERDGHGHEPFLLKGTEGQQTKGQQTVSIKFRFCGQRQTHELPADMTFGEVALKIEDQLHIKPYRLKLICCGRLLNVQARRQEPITQYHGKMIVILGSTNSTVALARRAQYNAEATEYYLKWRRYTYHQACSRLQDEYAYQVSVLDAMPAITSNSPLRRFGYLVSRPYENCRQEVESLFGFNCESFVYEDMLGSGGLIIPDLDCACLDPIIVVGCKYHIDVFLISFLALVELRMQLWLQRLKRHRFEVNPERRQALRKELDECNHRYARLANAWNGEEVDLRVLYDELLDLERLLRFDADNRCDAQTGVRMLNEGPDEENVFIDMINLQTALEILRGDYDKPKVENQSMTRIKFLRYEPPTPTHHAHHHGHHQSGRPRR